MTCIVGVTHGDRIWIGGDTRATSGWTIHGQARAKVFRVGEFLYGNRHYKLWLRTGSTSPTYGRRDPSERFAALRGHATQTGCIPWTGTITVKGYGMFNTGSVPRMMSAHRWAYEQAHGPIPEGFTVDHGCHTLALERGECAGGNDCQHRRCVNPEHLRAVPPITNVLTGAGPTGVNARKTECHQGHPLDGRSPDGTRFCRTCATEAKRRYAERNHERNLERMREYRRSIKPTAQQKENRSARRRMRYATDPEYRERVKATNRANHEKRREQ